MGGLASTVEPPVATQEAQDIAPGLKLIRPLARGGFAEVWEAEQVSLNRRVAVKILRSELLSQDRAVLLFDQEARVLARLNHPNVVQVIDRGTSPRGPFFVMEFVDGQTLQELVARGKIERERALTILMQAARGLAYAHRNNVIHRDVKPANILIGVNGQVKITDFGIAAVRAAAGETTGEDTGGGANNKKEKPLGTRAFMAPEQRKSFDGVGPTADVYSLGVILHRLVAGKLPPGPGEIADDVPIPEPLATIMKRALSLDPAARFPDAGAFREALVDVLDGGHLDDRTKAGVSAAIHGAGRFELLDVLRQDSWRSVYLVRRGGPKGEQIVVKRYRRDPEAIATLRAMTRVDHSNIVRIHVVAEQPDAFIILMEHCPGGDLRERLVRPHPWRDVARIGVSVASALAHAHRRGIVHGNLRPSNILFDATGLVRVADFGLPEHYRGAIGKRNWYAAPEAGASVAGDLFALGAILFEMLYALSVPLDPSERTMMLEHRKDLPLGLLSLLKRLLAPIDERCQNADLVVHDLNELLNSEEDREAPPRSPARSSASPSPPASAPRDVAAAPRAAPAASPRIDANAPVLAYTATPTPCFYTHWQFWLACGGLALAVLLDLPDFNDLLTEIFLAFR